MTIHFKKDSNPLFGETLKERIFQYFSNQNKSLKADWRAWVKGAIFFILYLTSFFYLLTASHLAWLFICFIFLGMLKIFLALNVAHDAAHNAFAQKKKINDLLLLMFDFLGANGYMWKIRHVHSHHPYANIPDHDADIKQSKIVRIFPNAPYREIHSYQHLYMPLLYAFYSLHWLLVRDFKDFLNTPENTQKIKSHTKMEIIRLITGKVFYFTLMLGLPTYLTPFSFPEIMVGFLLMQIAASYTVAMALASAHVGDGAVFPSPNNDGEMKHSWIIHQITTTTDFATDSTLITHLYGGFNHHLIHHLFPNICHIHYPDLTKILIDTCGEFNVQYNSNKSLFHSIKAHLKLLKSRSINQEKLAFPEF